jgi:hypothetical protein
MNRAITSNFHKPISASPETAYQVLRQFESRARLEESLAALGVEDRVISSHRIELAPRRASGYSLVWRLADGCRAELTWTALVRPDGDEGSVLSIRLRASADDARSRAQLLAAWPLLGRMGEQHARRTLAAVAELADRFLEGEDERVVSVPVLRKAS